MAHEKDALERINPAIEPSPLKPEYPRTLDYVDGYSEGDDGASIDLSKWLRWLQVILKRKWLIITLAAIGTVAITVETYRTRDTYQASTVIEAGKDNTSLAKPGDWMMQDEDDPISRHSLKTKMYLLRSTPLLEDVISDLKLDQNPRFLSDLDTERLRYKKKTLKEAVESISDRLFSDRRAAALASKGTIAELPTGVSGGNSNRSAEESERLEPLVDVIRNNLAVEQVPDTRLLKVSFTHTDPIIAASFSNYVVQCFIHRNFEGKTEKLTKTSEWLDRTTNELKARVENAEQALATYTEDHNIFATPAKSSLIVEKLTRLHGEVTRAETDRILKASLYDQVKQGKIAQIPEAFTDPQSAELYKKMGELVTKAAQFDVYYGPDNPQTIEVRGQIAAIQKQIEMSHKMLEEKFKTDHERAVRDEQAFKDAFELAKVEAVQENQDAIQYNILQQEVDTAKLLYKDFLQKTNQTKFELAREQNNLRVVEPARVPKVTVGPHRRQWIMLGFAMSLAMGIGLAILLEYLDRTIKSVEDVSRHVQLPALGIIPTITAKTPRLLWAKRRQKQETLAITQYIAESAYNSREINRPDCVLLDSRSPAAEAYRMLRTSVMLSVTGSTSKAILVTSSQPGEGKTTTTINTAISLAQLEASVLIIDCDLRTPTVHKVLGVQQEPGLSTYLSSDAEEIDGMIQKLQIRGLSLLPSGPMPDNPAELIGSKKMKEMLQMLGERYDHILIDSPPLINLADPVVLSTLVDGVILVVHGGRSTRDVVRRARQELSSVGANVFGVVLNNVDTRLRGYKGDY
jgi:capsular exopolysaccharide synthesis family protein